MPDYPRCKTCKHWDAGREQAYDRPQRLMPGYAACLSENARRDFSPEWEGDGQSITPGAFGCVHHEPNHDPEEDED